MSPQAHGVGPHEQHDAGGGMPESIRDAARNAFDSRPRDVLIADLVFDSLLAGDRRAGADPSRRSLRFGAAEAGVDLSVSEVGDHQAVVVQVLPRQRCEIEVRTPGSSLTVSTDDSGRVEFDVAPGLMTLVIRPTRSPHTRPLQTAWVRI